MSNKNSVYVPQSTVWSLKKCSLKWKHSLKVLKEVLKEALKEAEAPATPKVQPPDLPVCLITITELKLPFSYICCLSYHVFVLKLT